MEMLEALCNTGIDPSDVLRSHANDPELRNVSLRNFITLRHDSPTNERLRAEYVAIGNRGAMLLFNTHLGPATHDEIARRAYEIFEERGRLHVTIWTIGCRLNAGCAARDRHIARIPWLTSVCN